MIKARIASSEKPLLFFQSCNGLSTALTAWRWSAIVDFENAQHPLVDRRTGIAHWAQRAVANVGISEQVFARAQVLTEAGFGALDAAHVVCAEAAACECLLTCDDRLIRAARRIHLAVRVQNPVEYLEERTHA